MTTLGTIAAIDLKTDAVVCDLASEADAQLVLGGRGLNVLRLLRAGVDRADPLSLYRRMGWTPAGVPAASTLEQLGLTAFPGDR